MKNTSLTKYKQAILLPLTINEDKTFSGGMYAKDGNLIEACTFSKQEYTFIGPTEQQVDEELALMGTSFFCGYFTKDYATFLLEVLPRICSLGLVKDYDQLIFINTISDLEEEDFHYEPLELLKKVLNIPDEKILILEDVAKIDDLIVPHKASFDKQSTSPRLVDLISRIVKYCCSLHTNTAQYKAQKVFLHALTTCTNVVEIQDLFVQQDYQVINLEEITYSQQIAIVNQAAVVAGFFGQHLYSILFAEKETKLVCLDIPNAFTHKNIELKYCVDFAEVDPFFIREHEEVLFVEKDKFHYDLVYVEEQLEMTEQPNVFTLTNKNFTGGNYLEVLAALHKIQPEDYLYLEIGTNKGASLKLANGNCIAIDPSFILTDEFIGAKPELLLFQTTSDAFFESTADRILDGREMNFVFIDGSHQSEHAIKDFFNIEAFCTPDTVVVMHDVLPRSVHSSKKYRPPQGKAWTGDVWKAAYTLLLHRPDLNLCFLDAKPSGLLIITNIDPTFKSKNKLRCKELIESTRIRKDEQLLAYFGQLAIVDTDKFMENLDIKTIGIEPLPYEQLPTRKLIYHSQFAQQTVLR